MRRRKPSVTARLRPFRVALAFGGVLVVAGALFLSLWPGFWPHDIVVTGNRHEPVVPVHDVEREAVPELHAGGEHVGVHVLDPGDELRQLARAVRLAHPVDDDPADLLLGRRLLMPAREHVHVDPARHEVLRELPHVTRQSALDQRRVLPAEDQDAQGELDLDD